MPPADQLVELAKQADPFRTAPDNLAELQLEAMRERFAERRRQIRTLDRRANETGVTEIASFADMVPLLFAHTNYKSYPEAFIDAGQWKHMNVWLRTLCTYPTDDIEVSGVRDVDDWLDRAPAAGYHLFASSGTSGKSYFLDQSMKDRENAIPACLNAFDLATPSHQPNRDRSVFTVMPNKG